MTRRVAHLTGYFRDKPALGSPKPYAQFDLEHTLAELARLAHNASSLVLAVRFQELRDVDEEIWTRLSVLSENPFEQAVTIWESIVACLPQSAPPIAHSSDGNPKMDKVQNAGHPTPHNHLDTPSPETDLIAFTLQPFLGRVVENAAHYAEIHASTLGKSTFCLANRLTMRMRWFVVAGLRQAERRRAELVEEIEALHDCMRPYHDMVCGGAENCMMCGHQILRWGMEDGSMGEGCE